MGPIKAVDSVLSNFFTLRGRASRSEYWWWSLLTFIGLLGAVAVDLSVFDPRNPSLNPFSYLSVLFVLFTIPPGFTVTIRRLHDTGRSGAWYLISLVPFGSIVLFIFMILPSQRDDNIYGPPPSKSARADIGDAILDPLAPRLRPQKSNAFAVYARMEHEEAMRGSPELAEARKTQISEYYRQKVLGKS